MKYTKSCALNITACTRIISFSGNGGVRFRKRLKRFEKHRLGNFYGTVGFVILAVISIIVPQRHPNEIYCFPCNLFFVRIDFRTDLNSGSKKKEKTSTSGAFVTTRWSLILSGAGSEDGEKEVRAALAELCRIYWRPIFPSSADTAVLRKMHRTLPKIFS